jgi:hypothetical protein
MTLDDFFQGYERCRPIYAAIQGVLNGIGYAEIRPSKSQIAFKRKKAFAWVWIPGKILRGKVAPLVLSISLNYRDPAERWKEIVEPAPGRFMHHLELYNVTDIDDQVTDWLRTAWNLAV